MTVDTYATITQGSKSVQVLVTSIKHNFDKQLIVFSQPKQTPPLTYIIDLQRLKEVVTITGYLLDTTAESYHSKKRKLRDMMQTAGIMSLTWDSNDTDQPYDVNILKAEIKEVPGALEGDTDLDLGDTKVLNVMIQCVIGTHKG